MSNERPSLSSYWSPRYWHVWFGLGVLRLIVMLPHRAGLAIGRNIGRLAHALVGSRRAIVRRNIELCFPELSADERDALAKRHFEALGMSVIEMGFGRWMSDRRHEAMTRIIGLEHLERAVATGQGIIMLTAHFTTLEISGRLIAKHSPPLDAVYRKNRSQFITEIQRTGRERSAERTIEKRDIKLMVRALRDGRAVWYAPDQSYDRKGAEVIEFFGVPCKHTTATSTLARLGKAIVLPYFPRRLDDGTYEVTILPPLEDFPGDDVIADTNKYIDVLERHIRTCPEQYFWVHRKFKNLPDDYPDYYADLDALK